MSELVDKLERARFLAVQRLRRVDEDAADLLDLALFMENTSDRSISLHCVHAPDGSLIDVELTDLERKSVDSSTEDDLAERLTTLIQQAVSDGVLPVRTESA